MVFEGIIEVASILVRGIDFDEVISFDRGVR